MTSQSNIPYTAEEDEAWRMIEAQKRDESLESHAARRHAPVGYYARTVDDRLHIDALGQLAGRMAQERATAEKIRSNMISNAREIVAGIDDLMGQVDNANTGEVGTFTDGPEERYQAIPTFIPGSDIVRVFDRQRPGRAMCWGTLADMDLITDALNAWEASQ